MSSARGSRRTGHRWLEPGQCLEECTHDFLGLRMAVAESSGLASRLGSLAIVQGEQARQGGGASEWSWFSTGRRETGDARAGKRSLS